MSTLEARYRALLRVYPRAWRAANEEAVLGTLLDVADGEGRLSPSARETIALLGNGLATRLGASLPAPVRDGVATVALATGAALSLVFFLAHGWAPWAARDPMVVVRTFGPFVNPGVLLYAAWLIALALFLFGWRRAARIALAASVATAIGLVAASHVTGGWAGLSSTTIGFLGLLALLGLGGTPVAPRMTLVGFGVATAALAGVYAGLGVFGARYHGDHFFWLVPAGISNLGIALVLALLLASALLVARNDTAAAVVVIASLPWAAAWAVGSLTSRGEEGMALLVATAVCASLLIGATTLRRAAAVAAADPSH
ncbi:hypothetical protein [Microterricola pindariensis]|uniref:EamA domain-containing protein n=1 Tax=Microterricola pindariensis TaxID=478010 RepID=A0ABX5AX09_9MICO|nr:hypothetical protein [Microterricola pindariensis]PPL18983.1 hypothetical protein GY24_08450 [Microterricola pindariensis]